MSVAFSFDVEEHHRIEAAVGLAVPVSLRRRYSDRMEAATRWIADALAESGSQATFFVVGEIARSHPRLIRDLADAGHEIGAHGWDHRRVHHFTPESFGEDLRITRDALQQAGGSAVRGYRAPTFSVVRETAWAIDVLADSGWAYDSSIFPVRHDRYGVPNAPRFPFMARGPCRQILELPPVTWAVGNYNLPAAGGGYFRLFPPAVMRAGIAQHHRHPSKSAVLYFHPWEFDPGQPSLPLSRLSRFRTYVGIPRSRARLAKLLARYGSCRMIDLVDQLQRTGQALPSHSISDAVAAH